jgi:hypothetical protein
MYILCKVENTLFRIPRRVLIQSQYFRDMFESVVTLPEEQEGHSDERPIAPQGITAEDLVYFLKILNAK